MKKAVIWDLDGTLFDSYDVIVESLYTALREYGFDISRQEVHCHAIEFSIQSLLAKVTAGTEITSQILHQRYSQLSQSRYLQIKPMTHAMEALEYLKANGIENYVFTHRGKTTLPVLENLNMKEYFKDVITSQSGFPRKPDPAGIHYLLDKYGLAPASTYYVGDRSIDMECAQNAGIPGILFQPAGGIRVSTGAESYVIHDLQEIRNIL